MKTNPYQDLADLSVLPASKDLRGAHAQPSLRLVNLAPDPVPNGLERVPIVPNADERDSESGKVSGLVIGSPRMKVLWRAARACADLGMPILIQGEVGAGKSRLARILHRESSRRGFPIREICAIRFPESAEQRDLDPQLSALADLIQHGTLVLDEIGDLSFAAQTTLCRFLDLNDHQKPVNLIVLTQFELTERVREGRFRSDLLSRLSMHRLAVPPLRDRIEDLPLLCMEFIEQFREINPRVRDLSKAAHEALKHHAWRGNVRELRNRIERAMLLADETSIRPEDLGFPPADGCNPAHRTPCLLGMFQDNGSSPTVRPISKPT